jgi:peroxiredoxin
MTRRTFIGLSTAMGFMLATVVAGGLAFAKDEHHHDHAKLGEKAPDFTLKDQNGKDVKLADFKGKTVVLEWVNPGCPYVVRHYKEGTMANLAKQYAEGGNVVWLAINSGAGAKAEDMKAFAEKNKLSYPILMDGEGTVGKAYGAKTTPHMFVVNKDGKLAYQGGIDNDEDGEKSGDRVNYVKNALDELKAGKPVTKSETASYGCGIKYKG